MRDTIQIVKTDPNNLIDVQVIFCSVLYKADQDFIWVLFIFGFKLLHETLTIHSKNNIMWKIEIPKNSPMYPPILLKRQGNSQTRYSSLK